MDKIEDLLTYMYCLACIGSYVCSRLVSANESEQTCEVVVVELMYI